MNIAHTQYAHLRIAEWKQASIDNNFPFALECASCEYPIDTGDTIAAIAIAEPHKGPVDDDGIQTAAAPIVKVACCLCAADEARLERIKEEHNAKVDAVEIDKLFNPAGSTIFIRPFEDTVQINLTKWIHDWLQEPDHCLCCTPAIIEFDPDVAEKVAEDLVKYAQEAREYIKKREEGASEEKGKEEGSS